MEAPCCPRPAGLDGLSAYETELSVLHCGNMPSMANQVTGRPDQSGSPQRSPLHALDDGAMAQVVDFLDRHTRGLLELLAEFRRADRGNPVLLGLTARTQGRFQTPQCVMRPKILPPPDLAVAYEKLAVLRHQRKILQGYMSFTAARGEPGYVANVDDGLLAAACTLRDALEDIHGERIIFFGEEVAARQPAPHDLAILNSVAGGTQGTLIQAGQVAGGIHVTSAAAAPDPRVENPLIVTVEVVPGVVHADLVVDDYPPIAVTPSGSIYVLTVEARASRAVIIQRARAVVLSRREPRRACLMPHITGGLTPRRFDLDLDAEVPRLDAQGVDFPFTVSEGDPEQFWIQVECEATEVGWRIEFDWIVTGIQGTTAIGNGTGAFSVYPMSALSTAEGVRSGLRTQCDLAGHQTGCPALTLRQRMPNEPHNTFTQIRDSANECWYYVQGVTRSLEGR